MKETESEFVFAVTNVGSEIALKKEVEAASLGWSSSYQHKGFVTFKPSDGKPPFSLGSLDHPLGCARRLCLSLGKSKTREEAEDLVVDQAD